MNKIETMENIPKKTTKVGEMKNHSRICRELFSTQIHDPVVTGELLFLIRTGILCGVSKEKMQVAGNWWLWARNLFIENTMPKPMRRTIEFLALKAAENDKPIHFVSARSPELLHAQISNQGEVNLPRSRLALRTFSEIIQKSGEFIPTIGTILLADIAIDNLEAILKVCLNIEKVLDTHLEKMREIVLKENLSPKIQFKKISSLPHLSGKVLGDLINPDGSLNNIQINFSPRAEMLIKTVSGESFESHQRMFGWTSTQSQHHNRKLAQTMALVGQAIKSMEPPAILIHNEAFISRSSLNNLLIDPEDPLPVICLRQLLEKKKFKQ